MKKLFILCSCLISFLSCSTPKGTGESEMTFEEVAIEILQLYQNVNSLLITEGDKLYQLMLEHTDPKSEVGEEDKSYFLRNIAHIDSLVTLGQQLVQENKTKELLSLLEPELPNFYAHPNNTVDNEIDLHLLMNMLYYKHSKSDEEYINKVINLYDFTIVHIEAIKNKHPSYADVLLEQIVYCIEADCNKAILYGEKLSNYMLQTENEEGHVYASLILSKAYEKAGEPALQDSTINSVKNHPLYAECCNEINNIFEN